MSESLLNQVTNLSVKIDGMLRDVKDVIDQLNEDLVAGRITVCAITNSPGGFGEINDGTLVRLLHIESEVCDDYYEARVTVEDVSNRSTDSYNLCDITIVKSKEQAIEVLKTRLEKKLDKVFKEVGLDE